MPPMIGNQVLYSGVLISFALHGLHAFTTAGVRLKQKFSFSNICPYFCKIIFYFIFYEARVSADNPLEAA